MWFDEISDDLNHIWAINKKDFTKKKCDAGI